MEVGIFSRHDLEATLVKGRHHGDARRYRFAGRVAFPEGMPEELMAVFGAIAYIPDGKNTILELG